MNLGDFVKHVRQGPGRIVQIQPDYIEVRSRTGHVYKVSNAVADHELVPVSSDGFTALLATRDPSSEFLLENIVDVTRRIFRDRRKTSLHKKELREELEQFLKREGKSYVAWWKRAQKKLFESGSFVVDPKKKTNIVIAEDKVHAAEQDWTAELGKVTTATDLLDYGRRLYASVSEDDSTTGAARTAVDRIIRGLHSSSLAPLHRLELFLSFTYITTKLDQDSRAHWLKAVDDISFSNFPLARELDEDVAVAMALLNKISPKKAAEWAGGLLEHPSAIVVKRAFSMLNNDRFRLTLKKPLLAWLHADSPRPIHLDLYLNDAFLTYVRTEDKAALYVRLANESDSSTAVREFIGTADYARVAAESYRNEPATVLHSLPGKRLSDEARSQIISSLNPDHVLEHSVMNFDSGLSSYLAEAVKKASWSAFRRYSVTLLDIAQKNADVLNALVQRVSSELQRLEDIDLVEIVTLASRVRALENEVDDGLDRVLHYGWSRLISSDSPELPAMVAALNADRNAALSELTRDLKEASERASAATERAQAAEAEVDRLKSIINIVKTTAGEERVGSKHQALRDFVSALLPTIDELQRQAGNGDDVRKRVFSDVIAGLATAGLVQIGRADEIVIFDAHRHTLLHEERESPKKVVIVRCGFLLKEGNNEIVIRNALVRSVQEESH